MDRAILATVVVAVTLAGMAPLARSQALSATDAKAIDAVFADYDTPASPGCMLGVVSDGAFLYTRGYGRANIEHDVALTQATVFDIGSTSKQFLATAILLLVEDGKVSLDDDVRKYLPEVPDYGQPITIRHVLTHTSGLRDYITLLTLAGWQMEDVTSPAQALDFYAPTVGGERLVKALQTEGRLADGRSIGYGLGLFVGTYRGRPTVRHGGSWVGYCAELLRFPAEKTSVMVLCNLTTADPSKRANRVADIVLRGRLTGPAPKPEQDGAKPVVAGQPPWAPSAEDLDRYAGTYFSDELQARWQVARDGQTLVVRDLRAPARVLTPTSRDVFRSSGVLVTFDAGEGQRGGFTVNAGRARGMRFVRQTP